jgi:hypothetical protein
MAGPNKPKTGGRPPGTPNKATKEFRDTVAKVLHENSENVGKWLTMVAEGCGDVKADPGKALDLMAKLAEFAAPKLARTEVTGEGGGALVVEITRFGQ